MKTFKILTLTFLLTMLGQPIFAAATEQNLVDSFYESGKIKTVIAAVLLVLVLLIFYLIRLERKLNKLEKEQTNK